MSEEVWEEAVLKAVLDAPTKAQIDIDLSEIDKDENAPQNEHADLLQDMREGQIDKPSPRKWAAWILHQFGFTPFTDQCDRLVTALDAAYRFSCTLSRMSRDKGYDFHAPRHITDWGDASQLFYLCDESMRFLTPR